MLEKIQDDSLLKKSAQADFLESKKPKILVVVGPTAVGKTRFGIRLAQIFEGEIISGDSQQVYQGLDIGTAKATAEERAQAVHHLIDSRELTENFSAYDFVKEAQIAIVDILSRGKLPIIVGGTGLYLQALVEGYHLGGDEDHAAVLAYRESLSDLTDAELCKMTAGKGIRQPNRRRMIRALEIEKFGKEAANKASSYDFCLLGLNLSRLALYARINERVDAMLEKGLLDEACQLYQKSPTAQAAKAIGYKEFFPYFKNEISLEAAVAQVKQDSRRYAKRQLTWFKNRMAVEFFDVTGPDFPENAIIKAREFLKNS